MLSEFIPRGLKRIVEKYPFISFFIGLILFYIITNGLIETFTRTFFILFPIVSLFLVWVCVDYINQVREGSIEISNHGIDRLKNKFSFSFLINYFVFGLLDNKIITTFGRKHIQGFYSTEHEESYTNPEIDTYYTDYNYYCNDRTWELVLNYYDVTFMIVSILLTVYFYTQYDGVGKERL
jgi:hypothetical protein